jgi:hypothetical protein
MAMRQVAMVAIAAVIAPGVAGCIVRKNAPESGARPTAASANPCAGLLPQPHPGCYHREPPPRTDGPVARPIDSEAFALRMPQVKAVIEQRVEALRC